MVIILSRDEYELVTDDVIDWLDHYQTEFVRINGEDLISSPYKITINNQSTGGMSNSLLTNNEHVSVWYRRWYQVEYDENFQSMLRLLPLKPSLSLYEHVKREVSRISRYVWGSLPAEKMLDSPEVTNLNKTEVLQRAVECGLDIPDTLITNSADDVRAFLRKNERVVCKPIGEVLFIEYEGRRFTSYTKEIVEEDLDIPFFFPTLFQQMIPKKYEVRVFILNESVHAMAIFSQCDKLTKTDFRKYNFKRMNRCVPYNLPEPIAHSLKALMRSVNLKCGSIDLMKSEQDGKYYFLEINPLGQLGMVSKNCNYPLEKHLAEYLTKLQYE